MRAKYTFHLDLEELVLILEHRKIDSYLILASTGLQIIRRSTHELFDNPQDAIRWHRLRARG